MGFDRLLFGTAGIPLSTPERGTVAGIGQLGKLGLDNMEIEFVRGVHMKEDMAKEVDAARKREGKVLSVHGPYWINLTSLEKPKIHASEQRILQSARIGHLAGAFSVTFHAGFYMQRDKEMVYRLMKERLAAITKKLKDEGNSIWIRPELTGKETQWGDLDELIRISQDLGQVLPCIDFSHHYARYQGKRNGRKDWDQALGKVEKGLGREALDNMHIHISGIEYGPKGERNHVNLKECPLAWKELLASLKGFRAKGVVVCESPNIEGDAKLMKETYSRLP
ncbi:TIM barrel protein [Candidatus Woesearchaeota archaeon]|nr:TIM barrel protein [Candidatus Woesearchaeota archaeon]